MTQVNLFNILETIDSTNNYAMGKLHEGLATHGMAWFAHEQTAGKGQRGKQWQSEPGNNILLSLVLKPTAIFIQNPFYLSALVATTCTEFLHKITSEEFYIKWPNDLYWRDRKTGGILIENRYGGDSWNWAVVGIGINVNQTMFDTDLNRAISLRQVSQKDSFEPVVLARELHQFLMERYEQFAGSDHSSLIKKYNLELYMKDREVKLKKDNAIFSTRVLSVNDFGQLVTEDTMQRTFDHGQVEWIHQEA
jgi:BirA family biotin operon repressor/biotin-[acetyl-CoA-carboxylase] ligase